MCIATSAEIMPNLHIMRPALPDTAGLRHPEQQVNKVII